MKTLWLIFTDTKKEVGDPREFKHSFEIQEVWFDYNKYDRKITIKLNSPFDDDARTKALIPGNDRIVQFYLEEWDIVDNHDVHHNGYNRVGYGSLKGMIDGKIEVYDVVEEHTDLHHIEDFYRD